MKRILPSVYVRRFYAQSLAPHSVSSPQSDCGGDHGLSTHALAGSWTAKALESVWLLPPFPHLLGVREKRDNRAGCRDWGTDECMAGSVV